MNDHQVTCNPEWIELFLRQQLSDDEQAAFETHLSDCADCRIRLEAAAASDDIWSGVRRSLIHEQRPPDSDSPSADRPPDSEAGNNAPFDRDTVLRILAPTDDDRMIGRLGIYEVVGIIGSGGMGVVLKAFDAALNRYVAIKLLSPYLGSSGAARSRFSREAQAAAAVVHDNVIEIYGVADADGLPYLVMPYVRGPSLQRRLDDQGPLALVEILRIGMQTASGLAAAHAQGLVHRDVKPGNILLADGVERVKLTDFGLARAADDASLTKTGIIAGTPQYMSPEQARGESVDQQSDLFSLGSVLYAMCTGRAPFRAETSYGILRRITDEEARPIREINPEIPEWLCQIIARLMSKQPHERFASASEVAGLFEECLAHVQQPDAVPLPHIRPSHIETRERNNVSLADRSTRSSRSIRAFQLLAGAAVAFALIVAGVLIALRINDRNPAVESGNETPNLSQQVPAAGGPPEALDPLSHDQLARYSNYLWESLRSLQHRRSGLLTYITELEQTIAESEQSAEIPAGADAETKRQIERKNKIRAAKIGQASERIKLLREELGDIEPQIALLKKKLENDIDSPVAQGDRSKALTDSSESQIIGRDPGEPIYNDRLKRFKFRLEKIPVTSAAVGAQMFWNHYKRRGHPPIAGVWGDARTNSLVVVGPPEADQPIRDTIAEMEGATIGIDLQDDESLDAQHRQLQSRRTSALEQVALRKLEIIEAQARGKPDAEQLQQLDRKLATETAELETIERKLKVISDSIERLHGNTTGSQHEPRESETR